jgi:hypothetical protein
MDPSDRTRRSSLQNIFDKIAFDENGVPVISAYMLKKQLDPANIAAQRQLTARGITTLKEKSSTLTTTLRRNTDFRQVRATAAQATLRNSERCLERQDKKIAHLESTAGRQESALKLMQNADSNEE